MRKLRNLLVVFSTVLMISACTSGNQVYTPVVHEGKYYQPYKVNLKGQKVKIVKGMSYSCSAIKDSTAQMNIKVSNDGKSVYAEGYLKGKSIGSTKFWWNNKGYFTGKDKKTGKTEYLLIPKDSSKIGLTNNKNINFTDLAKSQIILFQCTLISNAEIMKYHAMSDQELQVYMHNQRQQAIYSAQTSQSIRNLSNQIRQNSYSYPIQRQITNKQPTKAIIGKMPGNGYWIKYK